jgi:hypothetical protein
VRRLTQGEQASIVPGCLVALDERLRRELAGDPEIGPRAGIVAAVGALLIGMTADGPAAAQKPGGVLRMPIGNSPASMSIREEATRIAVTPMMAVFNNLVLFDQHVPQNTFESIRPDLAESWSWDEDRTALTFRLHTGVKLHDGTLFTAKDVKCTWGTLAGRSSEKLRVNPRKSWYRNLAEVTVNGDNEVTFHLQRPQPSLLALLASGASPVTHATCRPLRCGNVRSEPARSSSSSSNRTNRSKWRAIRITGNQAALISTASNIRSSRTLVAAEITLAGVPALRLPDFWPSYASGASPAAIGSASPATGQNAPRRCRYWGGCVRRSRSTSPASGRSASADLRQDTHFRKERRFRRL